MKDVVWEQFCSGGEGGGGVEKKSQVSSKCTGVRLSEIAF